MPEKILVTRTSMPPYEEYIEAIRPLWESHWLTNMGVYHQKLEEELASFLQVPEVSLMVNGHMSLELSIQSFGFPEGSEVITTPFTFISTTHAIVRNRLKPVFCDVKEEDGTIDEARIEDLITEKTVAIVPVHVYGHICDIERIEAIADKYGLKVIYDAAHAFGEQYKGHSVAAFGDASVFSFHATKVFNTIEGGAVCCPEHSLYEKLHDLKDFGIRSEEVVSSVGANAKMNEFCAVMGLCNLKHIDEALSSRKEVFDAYSSALSGVSGISIFSGSSEATKNYAYFPILIGEGFPETRDELFDRLSKNNVFCRKYFYPITSDQACFKNKYRRLDLDIARSLSEKVLCLPIYEGLGEENAMMIAELIKETL